MRKNKFFYFFVIASALIFICLSALSIFASCEEKDNCYKCHEPHHNDEYKLLKKGLVNSGKIPCFSCHANNKSTAAPNVKQEFITSRSHHPVSSDKECIVCHILDKRHNDGNLDKGAHIKLRDPDPEDSHVYTGVKINDFCLSCHDNSPISLGEPPRTPVDLSSAYEFTGHGRIDINEPCTACHQAHASLTKPYLIKDVINSSTITGNDNSVCFACHSQVSESYPGKTAYLASEHGMRDKLCIDCHNPHGDNKDLCYLCHNDNYSSHYSAKRDKLCIDCHNPHKKDGLKMTKEDEEKLCYLCHKELVSEFGNLRDGISGSFSHHKVDDEEYGGGKVECVDCHNPHTITKLNIVSEPGSSAWSGPPKAFPKEAYKTKTILYDDFCLKCHDGSRVSAANIKAELSSERKIESGFNQGSKRNLHKLHKDNNFGCQNCHNSHSSKGTSGVRRGALLHGEIKVNGWNEAEKYNEGKNSCSSSTLGLGCH